MKNSVSDKHVRQHENNTKEREKYVQFHLPLSVNRITPEKCELSFLASHLRYKKAEELSKLGLQSWNRAHPSRPICFDLESSLLPSNQMGKGVSFTLAPEFLASPHQILRNRPAQARPSSLRFSVRSHFGFVGGEFTVLAVKLLRRCVGLSCFGRIAW